MGSSAAGIATGHAASGHELNFPHISRPCYANLQLDNGDILSWGVHRQFAKSRPLEIELAASTQCHRKGSIRPVTLGPGNV